MKIGIFGNEYQAEKQDLLSRLFNKLSSLNAETYVDGRFHKYLTETINFKPEIKGVISGDTFDLDVALSVGGDGTFLYTAERVNKQNIPILGINSGRLGFLADTAFVDIEKTLDDLFNNNFVVEERALLKLTTDVGVEGYNYALNEISVLKRDTSSMITIHTQLNSEYLTSYLADGLVIATPTGSTAYSMSVNGPIIVPECNNIVLSPVAPHSLNVRPLVVPDSYTIKLTVESRSNSFLVALDGRWEDFDSGVELTITKANYTTKVLKYNHKTFYQTLREKLMWGADARK